MNKLFILPYAGGTPFYFREIKRYLDKQIKVIYITIPGRKNGKNEMVYQSIAQMSELVSEEIEKESTNDDNYAIFGHSLGCLLAYEIYYILKEKQKKLPKHLFCSGMLAPARLSFYNSIHSKMSKGKTAMEKRLEDMSVFEMDMHITNHYTMLQREKMDVDISVLYGNQDNLIRTEKDILYWEKLTQGVCSFYEFSGDHYYFQNNIEKQKVAEIINGIFLFLTHSLKEQEEEIWTKSNN